MQKLSTSIIFSLLLGGSFWQCQDQDKVQSADPQVYVSADRNEVSQRITNECAFRYTIANSFAQLDNSSQREAIRAGFAMWQKMSPNVSFLEFATSERAILVVRFVSPDQLQAKPILVSEGLLRGPATVTSALRQENNGLYSILLSTGAKWSTNMLTRAVAYHAGLLLGIATSADAGSLMSLVMQNQIAVPTKADSIALNRLYVSPCASYLPISLKVNSLVTKTVKFDKQGTVVVKASGQINVGFFVGVSAPDGRDIGSFGFSPAAYNLVPSMNHAALMYKLNDEVSWHYCGKECSFSTGGNQSVNLIFNINDSKPGDNVGAYDVMVQYQ